MKVLGHVVRNQVPMFISHDEDHVKFVCEHLADAMERAYTYYEFFSDEEYIDE